MNQDFDKAAKAHNGKFAQSVTEMYTSLGKHATEKDRLHAVIDNGVKNLQAMKASGATIDDVMEALSHIVDNKAVIIAGVKSGVK